MSFGAIENAAFTKGLGGNVTAKSVQDSFYWMGRQIKDLWNKTSEAMLRVWLKIFPYIKEGAQKVLDFFRTGPGIAAGAAALAALLWTLSYSPEVEDVRLLKITMRVLGTVAIAGSVGAIIASVFKGPSVALI